MQENKELYQRDSGESTLYPYLITCTDKGVQEQKYTDDVAYYDSYKKIHSDFIIDSVQQMTYTEEQLSRLDEIQGLKYKDFDEIYDYVINGHLRNGSKIFAAKIAERNRADIDYLAIMTEVKL